MRSEKGKKSLLRLGTAVLVLLCGVLVQEQVQAQARTIDFDFEDQMPTPGRLDQGRLSSLTLVKDGVAVRITRPGSVFDLRDNPGAGSEWKADPSWGAVSLSTFFETNSATPLLIEFSVPVAAFSLDIGDFSQDTDALELEAFSEAGGQGTSLARQRATLDNNDSHDLFTFKRLEVRGENIRSVRVLCGSAAGAHSMYYDNLSLEIAEPPSG